MLNKELNQSQKEAVEYFAGPLIIVAGAGTGKTTVITEKITKIIDQKLAAPEEILALTFTDKAAMEMSDRVDAMINLGYVDLQISTFHSFCQKIIEQYGLHIGLNHKSKLLTEVDAWLLARKNLDKFNLDYYRPLGNPSSHIHALIAHFQKCKDELIAPAEYLSYAENISADKDSVEMEDKSRLAEIANAYHIYNQLLLDNNSLDFADLIFYAIKLLKERPAILKSLQNRFKYILIDEFQDVNFAQYQLVKMLVGSPPLPAAPRRMTVEGGNKGRWESQLTVVGDDDQSIYAFRGASVSNILRFKDDFPTAKEIVLNKNYRSRQEILDCAYKLIQNNNPDRLEIKLKLNKKLIAKNSCTVPTLKASGTGVEHIHCSTVNAEAKAVVDEIIRIKQTDSGAVWDNFAILVRANSHSEPFISALQKAGIPYEFLAAAGLYRQPLILDCLNFFKVVDNYRESTAIYRLLAMPFWQMNEHDLQIITSTAKRKSVSCYELIKNAAQLGLSPDGLAITEKLLRVISAGLQNARQEKPTTVLFRFLTDSGLLEYLAKEEEKQNGEMIRQIYQLQEFLEYINKFENDNAGASVAGFLEHFNYVIESGDLGSLFQPTDTPDSVNIITIHKAKGLEFKYVFVANLVEDRFPARRRNEGIAIPADLVKEQLPEGDSHIQEERRLFYVALTRAKERLVLTSADDYGGARTKKICRFLPEIGFKILADQTTGSQIKKLSPPTKAAPDKSVFAYQITDTFSFSQIKTYSTCPYQYKLAHVLKIPTRGNASFSFGQSLHSTMQKFYERLKELNTATQTSLFSLPEKTAIGDDKKIKAPTLEELLNFYDESWLGDWYNSQGQREEYYQTGKDILRAFYLAEQDHWTIPVSLESGFKIKIGDYLLRGRIDRIDQLPDKGLEIIDYKTGAAKAKVEGEDKDQLLIYQIAAEQLPEYKNIGAPKKLTYFYLNENAKVSFLGTDKEIAKLKEKIINTAEEIKSGNFAATPSQHICRHCDFKDICQFRA